MSDGKEAFKAVQEEMKNITPQEVEQAMIAKAMNQAIDPLEVASMLYGLYLPKFKMGMRRLSSRARMRVLNYLVEYPLNEGNIKPKDKLESELIAMGHAVLESKFMMILSTMNEGLGDLFNAADPSKDPDLTEEERKALEEFMNPHTHLEFGSDEEPETKEGEE